MRTFDRAVTCRHSLRGYSARLGRSAVLVVGLIGAVITSAASPVAAAAGPPSPALTATSVPATSVPATSVPAYIGPRGTDPQHAGSGNTRFPPRDRRAPRCGAAPFQLARRGATAVVGSRL